MADSLATLIASIDTASISGVIQGIEAAFSSGSIESWLSEDANSYITNRAAQRFANEGDDVVGQWAQLAPSTVAIRQTQGFGGAHPINKRTGELEAYIVNNRGQTDLTAEGAQLVTPGDSPDGELALKLAMAQSGGNSKWGGPVPKRPVLGINAEDGLVLTEMLKAHIEAHIGLSGSVS